MNILQPSVNMVMHTISDLHALKKSIPEQNLIVMNTYAFAAF